MTKRRIVRSILSVFLSLVLIINGFLPGMPFVSTVHAESTTKTITPGTDDAKTGTGTMEISLTIKKTPSAGDFTFKSPTSLIYDGQAKAATVSTETEGMGEVTVEYYNGDTKLSGAPTAEGTYTVKVNVAEGDDYKAATGITDDDWTFTILPMQKTMTITLVIHGHEFTYGAEGATITATCGSTVGTCDLTDKKVSLTLNAPEKKKDTDSLSASATLDAEKLTAFNKATGLSVKESDIEYYKGETKLDAAPTEKGDYTAKLTVGTGENMATASVDYSIETTTQTGSMEITLTIAAAEVKTAPTANELKYNGTEQALVTSGEAKVGTMQYQIGESATTAPTGTWSDTVPKGKNAGTYYVWYRAYVGEKNFTDAECVTASVAKRSVTLTSATATKAYDGTALTNTNVAVSGDGFVTGEGATYDVTGSQTLAGESANAFTYALSDGTIADNYDITTVEGKLTVTKSDSSGEVTAVAGLVYDGKAKALVTAVKTEGGSMMYALGTDGKWQSETPEATDAGIYKIYYYIKGDDNHNDNGSEKEPKGSVETTIKKAAQDKPTETFATTEASDDKTADGKISGLDKAKTYQYSAADGKTWTDVKAGSTEIVVKSGTYQIRYAEDKNHEAGKAASVTVTAKAAPSPEPAKTNATINLKSVTQKNNKVQVSWTKVNEADGYDVYIHYCGSKAKKAAKTIKGNSTTSASFKKIDGKKINQKKNFHVKVYAYKMVDGKKAILAKTITAHLAGTKSVKYTNPKALKLTKSAYQIKVKKTAQIKAKVTLENSSKKLHPKSHANKLRYKSSNTKIATVDKNGKITGKSKGTCYIYVYTVNGLMKKAKITVK